MRRILAALFLLALLGVLSAQETSVETVKKRVAEIGEMPFIRDVPVRYLNRPELKKYLDGLFARDYPAELSAREEEYLWLMGFVEKRVELQSLRRQVVLENAGGLYNEKTKELLAMEEYRSMDMINAMALVHEFRHAIQDQHAGLGRLLGELSDFDDRRLAVLSAIEGDATLIMIRYMGLDPESVSSFFNPETVLSLANVSGQALSQAPDIVRYQLLAPYLDGLHFAATLFGKGGQKRLNRVLNEPPLSSAQILHPQLYLEHSVPVPVRIRFQPSGWEKYHDGVVGEYYLNVLLKSGSELLDTGAGWNGDRFEIWRRDTGRALLYKSTWQTAADCGRVFAEMKRFLQQRFQLDFKPGSEAGREFLAAQTDSDYFFLSHSGQNMFYLRTNNRQVINDFIGGGIYD